jgi:hypothetical protein
MPYMLRVVTGHNVVSHSPLHGAAVILLRQRLRVDYERAVETKPFPKRSKTRV